MQNFEFYCFYKKYINLVYEYFYYLIIMEYFISHSIHNFKIWEK